MTKQIYDLIPTNGRKSFYGKARVEVADDGSETLISYITPIIRKNTDGTLTRLYNCDDLSNTTCTHIKSFCGLCKAEFLKIPVGE